MNARTKSVHSHLVLRQLSELRHSFRVRNGCIFAERIAVVCCAITDGKTNCINAP